MMINVECDLNRIRLQNDNHMIRGDEVSESAKAVQESAKAIQEVAQTTRTGIEVTEKVGRFVSDLIGEPLETAMGMLSDWMRYSRWERQQRFTQQAQQLIAERNIVEPKEIQPKIVLPILTNATMEDNDELQDHWVRLITTAVDPSYDGSVRSAFIDILKELEVQDAHVLSLLYSNFLSRIGEIRLKRPDLVDQPLTFDPSQFHLDIDIVMSRLGISKKSEYRETVDNLIRVRCVGSFVQVETVYVPSEYQDLSNEFVTTGLGPDRLKVEPLQISKSYGYDKICLTSLGLSFARACMDRHSA